AFAAAGRGCVVVHASDEHFVPVGRLLVGFSYERAEVGHLMRRLVYTEQGHQSTTLVGLDGGALFWSVILLHDGLHEDEQHALGARLTCRGLHQILEAGNLHVHASSPRWGRRLARSASTWLSATIMNAAQCCSESCSTPDSTCSTAFSTTNSSRCLR